MVNETRMVAVDGTDALAYVILRPGSDDRGVVIEAAAKGISKAHAAYALRHTAQSWDPDDSVGADVGQQLKDALAEVEKLRSKLERAADPEADILIDCATCSQPAHWIDCPTGGWWAHEVHPADGHDAAAVEIDLINEIGLLGAVNGELAKENASLRAESEQRLGELLFWEFEYREAMDNYRGESQHAKSLRAELEQARAEQRERDARTAESISFRDGNPDQGKFTAEMIRRDVVPVAPVAPVADRVAAPAYTCAAEPVHQAGCQPA